MSMVSTSSEDVLVQDAEELERMRLKRIKKIAKWFLPTLVMIATVAAWHFYVVLWEVPHYILPGPGRVAASILDDRAILWPAMLGTGQLTLLALVLAIVGGGLLAILFTQSEWAEMSFFPYAIILQVTPVVAIAPLLQIYLENGFVAALLCAWLVAFFPILSNTIIGLKSTDHNLEDLFTIYEATVWQRLAMLKLPTALPFFLGGLKIASGLALIGAVVAEFVIGRAGTGVGLASTLLEASYRFNFPRLYASLILISAMGIVLFAITATISHLALRNWHESALKRE